MKSASVVRMPHVVDYWDFETGQDFNGQVNKKFKFNRVVKGFFIPATQGYLYFFSREKMDGGALLKNARDNKGNLVASTKGINADLPISHIEVQFNVMGGIEGYRYMVKGS